MCHPAKYRTGAIAIAAGGEIALQPSVNMPPDDESLYLYHLTLARPTAAFTSVLGQFLANKKSQELVLATLSTLELWQLVPESGKLKQLCLQQAVGTIQSVDRIRKSGSNIDLLVVSSDSGRLAILEFDANRLNFFPVIQEPHSKNGLNRNTPGEYLCVDPHDRTITIGALERDKLTYKVQSDQDKITLLSPLESTAKGTLTLRMAPLDTGYENPMVAAIECDYSHYDATTRFDPETSPLTLRYYELEQGLNYVAQQRDTLEIPASSTILVSLPAPMSGVLVAGTGFVMYHNPTTGQQLYLPLPARKNEPPVPIVGSAVHKLKKNKFFILLHNELGDLFRVMVDHDDEADKIAELSVAYFDTIPQCTSINVLKKGYLFANVTSNDKMFYQIEDLGDEELYTSSANFTSEDILNHKTPLVQFEPRGLTNLALVQIIDSSASCFGGAIIHSNEGRESRIAALTGNSHLKLKTHGIPISTLVASPLPLVATSVFTTRLTQDSASDDYMIISSAASSKTLVLGIGEVVEEVQDSLFVIDQATIGVQQVGRSSVVQVYSNGIRHIRQTGENAEKKTFDWYPPAGITITTASTNKEQVLIGLSNRELCYFEIDPSDDQLIEYQERIEMPGGQISALAIASAFATSSERKSPVALVACADETVQVISLQPHNCLETLTFQALSANCVSAAIIPGEASMVAHIGLENGLYVRSSIEDNSGKFNDTRVKYLGADSVHLSPVTLGQQVGILAISSQAWVSFRSRNKTRITPLMGADIVCGTSFTSEDIGSGIVGASSSELTIFTIGGEDDAEINLDDELTMNDVKLRYFPTKMLIEDQMAFVIESEFGVCLPYLQEEPVDEDFYSAFGYKRAPQRWAACVQLVALDSHQVVFSAEIENNQKPLSLCKISFDGQQYLCVGVSQNLSFDGKNTAKHAILTYTIKDRKLQLLHSTEVDHPPAAMVIFNDRLLVGMGKYLRLYTLGKKQLLRKSSTFTDYLSRIVLLSHQGNQRIVAGDVSNSTTYFRYDQLENIFVPFADDVMKRHTTALARLDYDTVIGGDKFGNIFVNRISRALSNQADQDWSVVKYQDGFLNSAGNRVKGICEFFLNDIPTLFFKGTLVTGGKESIFYTGIHGTLGFFEPLASRQEVNFFHKLEIAIREALNPNLIDISSKKHFCQLLGKDHIKFRGYYNPVKNVIDGDFVENYTCLDPRTRSKIATALDRNPRDIDRKIAEIRDRVAF